MTENNTPTCERCGSTMVEYYMRSRSGWASQQPSWICPLNPKDCELKALRSENEALRKRNDELEGKYQFMVDRAADEKLDGYRELASKLCSAESRAQELETKLRAAEDAVVVLRLFLEGLLEEGYCSDQCTIRYCSCGWIETQKEMRAIISSTSVLAAQRKREIVLEALKKIINHLNGSPSGFLLTLESFMSILDLDESEDHPLDKCPNCGGPADNGFDRCIPPNVYFCSKCDPHSNTDN